jgi:cobalt-zinc-cadmium efflux system outer membrane protein
VRHPIINANRLSCGRIALVLTLAGLLSGVPSGARAERMTLDAVVQLAMQRAPQLDAQRAASDSASERAVAAGRLPDPELRFGIDNVPIDKSDAWSLNRDFMTMRKVGVMQDFPNARKRASQRDLAGAQIRLVEAQTRETQLQVAQSASAAWVELATANRLIESLGSLKDQLQMQAEASKASVRAGSASTLNALAAQGAVLEIEDQLLDARRGVRAARASLARWVGERADSIEAADDMPYKTLSLKEEQLLTTLHQHAALLTSDAQIDVARQAVNVARAEKRADWGAGLTYAKRGDAFSDMVSIEFRVGLPLFSAHRQDPEIRARQADVRKLEAERESDLRMHSEEISQVLAQWQSARDRIELLERERLPLVQARRTASIASYRVGGASLTEVLESVTQETQLQQRRSELTRELGRTWTYLHYLQPGSLP